MLAGTAPGFNPDDDLGPRPGTQVMLLRPRALETDGHLLYVADTGNNRVRVLNLDPRPRSIGPWVLQPGEMATLVGGGPPDPTTTGGGPFLIPPGFDHWCPGIPPISGGVRALDAQLNTPTDLALRTHIQIGDQIDVLLIANACADEILGVPLVTDQSGLSLPRDLAVTVLPL